ncbi:hypothetical protein CH251_04955 [Rhodococcus sp. 06-462-5]|uniref:zinc ribbon domain-containing protein n=1 Tax=unclassified Rhodococcus (in: high G+C Gram-positive bacteria) TaxID=192944 RepID=UPI000B9C47DD|nr:hypothetical protein CH251_04955 [Rhodococcus sp. 06-462-5]OZE61858.1 hypothetical protein CH270_19345 [Rhodococcus sp. 02-925g]
MPAGLVCQVPICRPDRPSRTDSGSARVRARGSRTRQPSEPQGPDEAVPVAATPDHQVRVCGSPAYRGNRRHRADVRYRCATPQYKSTCGNRTIREDYADDVVESLLVTMLGESERNG